MPEQKFFNDQRNTKSQGNYLPPSDINQVVSEGSIQITGVVKKSGEIEGYQLSNGQIVSKDQAIQMAKAGSLAHVGVAISRGGHEYLRSLPDGDESNNLDNLPTVTN